MFGVFTLAIKFHYLFLGILKTFHWLVTLLFDKLAPPQIYVSKDALNHLSVNSSAKDSLRRAKNVVFFLFRILVVRPPAPTWLRYWPLHPISEFKPIKHLLMKPVFKFFTLAVNFIAYVWSFFLMKPVFKFFILAINFIAYFWSFFKVFFWFVSFIFDELAPLKHMFQKTH